MSARLKKLVPSLTLRLLLAPIGIVILLGTIIVGLILECAGEGMRADALDNHIEAFFRKDS